MNHQSPKSPRTTGSHAEAFEALDRLVSLNVAQTSRIRPTRRAEPYAEAIGIAAITYLATMCAWCWWLRDAHCALARAGAPCSALARASAARAPRRPSPGASAITRQFNDMAASIAAHRDAMMALLGGVAHDLRTPLSALTCARYSFAPTNSLPDEPAPAQTLAIARRQAARLERMLADFLDFARIEASTLELRREDAALCQLAREVVAAATQRPKATAGFGSRAPMRRCW